MRDCEPRSVAAEQFGRTASARRYCLPTIWMLTLSWISRGIDEPVARSAGQFEVNVGTPCILELMKWFGLKSTFFTPGWIAEQYPAMVEAVVRDGHEIGLHGYLHEPPPKLSEAEEIEAVRRGSAALEAVTGVRPVGYRSPIWQFSANTVRILHQAGFEIYQRFHAYLAADLE